MKELYRQRGFIGEYYEDTRDFFLRFMEDEESVLSFFDRVFENDSNDKNPRKMMNQVVRWVGLAEDIQKIRPARDPLIVFCIRSCIESKKGSDPMNKL